ncbi:LysE family transporter [Mangrovactinospora gilvigrisea]|uniref:LysE family transporter n=1 Tax=Mangrovactinospora gilvigrisea TaxID=1428644 RepID=UPI00269CE1A5
MDVRALGSGLWAGYGLAVPIGAVAVLMIAMTARSGLRSGAAAALGATAADAVYAVAAALGGAALADAVRPLAVPLRWTACAVLLALAARALRGALRRPAGHVPAPAPPQPLRPARAFLSYFALTALNPWPALYFSALMLGGGIDGGIGGGIGAGSGGRFPALDVALYVLGIVLASAS